MDLYDELDVHLYNGLSKGARGGTELQFRLVTERLSKKLLNKTQLICSRVRKFLPDKKKILWIHDHETDIEYNSFLDIESKVDHVVYVSHIQQSNFFKYRNASLDKSSVIKNSIVPIEEHKKPENCINLIYHTTPHRGLELLIPAYLEICKKYSNIHLNVFSSFSIYNWPHRDLQYQKLFDICKNHPNISYHGTVSNDKIREYLKQSHIFAYPNIWPETSCIAAIEAISARCLVVCPKYEGLIETVGSYGITYDMKNDMQMHMNYFVNALIHAIDNYQFSDKLTSIAKYMIDREHNIEYNIHKWEFLLERL